MTEGSDLRPAALYARVSSDRQDVDLSVAGQLRALRDYAEKNGCVVVREYVDEAQSGRDSDRPEFNKMIDEAKIPKSAFQEILVRKKGYKGAARVLEIDQRTVAKSAKSGQFTHRVREALERALQEGVGSAADRQRRRNEKLDAQLKELKEELRGGLKGLNRLEGQLDKLERQVGELRETLPSGLRRLRMSLDGVRKYYGVQRRLIEQRLSALEVGQRMTGNEASAGGESVDPGSRSVAAWSAHTKGRGHPWEPAGAETEADAAEEMQIIVSVKGGKATIGVHQPSSAPYIETFDDADLSDLGKDVAMATERARATWEAAPIIALRAPSSPGPAS